MLILYLDLDAIKQALLQILLILSPCVAKVVANMGIKKCYLKEACKKYTDLTAERLPQVDPMPQI